MTKDKGLDLQGREQDQILKYAEIKKNQGQGQHSISCQNTPIMRCIPICFNERLTTVKLTKFTRNHTERDIYRMQRNQQTE